MTDTFLRRDDVQRITGLSRSTLYALMADGRFPKQFKISGRAAAWSQKEIANWQSRQIANREKELA